MSTLRSQIEYCFQQATQGGRFSQQTCVDRLVELVERERLATLEKAADFVEHYLDDGGSVFSLSNITAAMRADLEKKVKT